MECLTCNSPIHLEGDIKRQLCFKCHIGSITFGFKGAQEGKSNWNGPTIREIQRSYEDSPEFKSGKISKVPARAELI